MDLPSEVVVVRSEIVLLSFKWRVDQGRPPWSDDGGSVAAAAASKAREGETRKAEREEEEAEGGREAWMDSRNVVVCDNGTGVRAHPLPARPPLPFAPRSAYRRALVPNLGRVSGVVPENVS